MLNGLELEARLHLALAANYAGIGFGNAGVHIPHAVAYPIAGLVRDWVPRGYPTRHPLVPDGVSVILTAPAAFRFTYATSTRRRPSAICTPRSSWACPCASSANASGVRQLPRALIGLMQDIGVPNDLTAVGYTERDVPALIDGTLRQPRLLAGAPRPVGAAELELILRDAMRYW